MVEIAQIDPSFTRDPVGHAVMWGSAPVWLVTSYAEARVLLADPRLSKDRDTGLNLLPPNDSGELTTELANHTLQADPPDHTRLRKLVGKAYAGPLPVRVIGELLGIPVRSGFQDVLGPFLQQSSGEQKQAVTDELTTMLTALIADKRRHPAADVTSALLRHPSQLAASRADPTLMSAAVEGSCGSTARSTSPPSGITEAISVGGVEIGAGQFVMLSLLAANHDPRHFMAFGHGIHTAWVRLSAGWKAASPSPGCWTARKPGASHGRSHRVPRQHHRPVTLPVRCCSA